MASLPSPRTRAKRTVAQVRRSKFVQELVARVQHLEEGQKLSLGEVAVAVGLSPNGARQAGSRMLSDVDVQAELKARLDKAMQNNEILEGLSQIARGKRASKVVVEDGETLIQGQPVNVRKTRREYNRQGGYEAMARIRGLVKDGPPPPVQAINVNVVLPQVPEEVLWKLREVLSKAKLIGEGTAHG